jgi:hypothetical protein
MKASTQANQQARCFQMTTQTIQSDQHHTPPPSAGKRRFRSRLVAYLVLLLLGLQFLLGIVANLYVQIPDTHPGSGAENYFVGVLQGIGWVITQGAWALQLHATLGLLLILLALLLTGLAFTRRERVWMILSPIGAIGMIGAGFNGASFINYGHDFSSLLMSVGFLLALVSYLVGLYLTAPAGR